MIENKNTYEGIKSLKVPQCWVYRGEGNSNLVISLPNTGKVLHIKKCRKRALLIQLLDIFIHYIIYLVCLLCLWIFRINMFRESINILFYNNIMRLLIGEEYVSEAREVMLSRSQVNLLEKDLEHIRPAFRRHKNLQYGRATILDDFALLSDNISNEEMLNDSFAIEIKPKQGWIPLSMKLYPKCVYCMNQYLKLSKGSISSVSSYCPEDFFSGNELLMIKSIKALIKNPQNNFRIFKNGHIVYGQEFNHLDFVPIIRDMFDNQEEDWISLQETFCYLVKECLTRKLNNNVSPTRSCSTKTFCEWDTSMRNKYKHVSKGSVVERILSVQMLDVEGCLYYRDLLDAKSLNSSTGYVETLLKEIKKYNNNTCIRCTLMSIGNVTQCPKRQIDLRGIPYWISSIANDCSLMLTFRKLRLSNNNGRSENLVSTKFGTFAVRVGVFDLFPKKADIIKRHVKRNEDIFKAYVENVPQLQLNNLNGHHQYNGYNNNDPNSAQFSPPNSGNILNRVKNVFKGMF